MSTTTAVLSLLLRPSVLLPALIGIASFLLYSLRNSNPRYTSRYATFTVDGTKDTQDTGSYPSLAAALKEAFPKFRNAAYVVTGKRPFVWTSQIIVPPKWIEKLKALPDDQLSFQRAVQDRFNNTLTHVDSQNPNFQTAFIKSISVDLTRHISKIMDAIDDELNHAFGTLLPACDDWTEVYPGQILPQIVALASGRIFVGLPLCRDPEFIKATITFTVDAFMAGEELNKYPKWLRPYVAPWLKLVKTCAEQHVTMRRILEPELIRRKAMVERGEELPIDVMTWMIKNSLEKDAFDVGYQAHAQLGISLAAIHTTTMTTAHAWLDLTARPEYLDPLREEWNDVLATEPTGVISKASMPKLKKLDSFLKESQRVSPLGPTTFDRKVIKDLQLPDGTELSKGTYIAVASSQIGMDKDIWQNPEEFDGFRFEKLRQQAGQESKYQFATTGIESMHFGHGKHACPGRFFAANEIKLILAYILRNYDMKFPDGQDRPKNIATPSGTIPDYSKPVLMKRRKAQ